MFNCEKTTFLQRESKFIVMILLFALSILVFRDTPKIAMWIGFGLAGFSAISNDSIQTLGTFITSNHKVKWWILWIFIGGIMAVVVTHGWIVNSGDIAFGRLEKIPEPVTFSTLQLIAPLALMILTRMRMPVSTTFLILSVFSSGKTIGAMLEKSFLGYVLAFLVSIAIWAVVATLIKRKSAFVGEYNEKRWRILQWITTAYLWSTWLMHDIANATVFLPRNISTQDFIIILGFLILVMGYILYKRGGRIQAIIVEKTDVTDVRSATLIDFVLGSVLFFFKELNSMPMSTTWVFLGVLAGREFALSQMSGNKKPYMKTLGLVMKDISYATIGIIVSLIIATLANPNYDLGIFDLTILFK